MYDLVGATRDCRLAVPRSEVMVGADAQYIALAGTAQCLLDITDTIDAVRRHPGEGKLGSDRQHPGKGVGVNAGVDAKLDARWKLNADPAALAR